MTTERIAERIVAYRELEAAREPAAARA